jgi:MinD-like ATPase involved in chromosome partitioning or flagellar assembly
MSVDPEDPAAAPVPEWRPNSAGADGLADGAVDPPTQSPATPPDAVPQPAVQGQRDPRLWPVEPRPSPQLRVERVMPMPDVQRGHPSSGLLAYLEQRAAVTPNWVPAAPASVYTHPAAPSTAATPPAPARAAVYTQPAGPAPAHAQPVAGPAGPAPDTATMFGIPPAAPPPSHFAPDRLVKPKAPRPGRGVRRLLFRSTGGRLNLGRSATEEAELELVARVRTPAATGRRRVAFVSLKGGVGKTTTTVMLGHTLATYRGDNVIAIDANPDAGNLASRVPRQTPAAARDLLRAAGTLERYADVRAFTSQAGSRLQVLAGESDPALSEAFSAEDYAAVLNALERFYSIILTDCGTGILHDAMRAVLWYADQLVIITSPALDSAQALNQLLEWLDRHGYHHLVQPAIVVVNGVRRDSEVGASEFLSHFGPRCRAVVTIPYDKGLSIGGEVDLADLDGKTQRAYLDLAAAVADGFTAPRLSGH